jgi:hypothetical protein
MTVIYAQGGIYASVYRLLPTARGSDAGFITMLSHGHPDSHDTIVFAHGRVEKLDEAKVWFDSMLLEQPWMTRQ